MQPAERDALTAACGVGFTLCHACVCAAALQADPPHILPGCLNPVLTKQCRESVSQFKLSLCFRAACVLGNQDGLTG